MEGAHHRHPERSLTRDRLVLVAVDIVVLGGFQVAAGYVGHRLPSRSVARERWLFRARGFERDGALYVNALRIRRWKKWLPEAGDFFAGGFNKARLAGSSDGYLTTFLQETRRAEATHWLAMAPAPLFFLWNPWYAGALIQAYALVANLPCIASQRYNRIRLVRVLGRARPGPGGAGSAGA